VSETAEKNNNNTKKKKAIIIISAALILVSVLVYFVWTRGQVSTDDAYVDGHIFSISPRVPGYVTQVLVDDNECVEEGQPLVTLDSVEYEVALAEARANLAEAESTLTALVLGVPLELTQTGHKVIGAKAELDSLNRTLEQMAKEEEAAKEQVKAATAESELAILDVRRKTTLKQSEAISQQVLDESQTKFQTTQAQMGAAKARLETVQKQRASLEADEARRKANIELAATGQDLATIKDRQKDAQQSRVELAKARVKQAELNLGYTKVLSPTRGCITRKKVEPGFTVARGQPLMAVVPILPKEVWITANYKETQLAKVRPGQPVAIEVDTYPGITFKGTVDSIMAGTGAVFSLFPPENATGNFVKVVQRVPVKIVLDSIDGAATPVLRIGMSVIPTIFTNTNAGPNR
jgi:membrane fusion protein, multidrug efflux system